MKPRSKIGRSALAVLAFGGLTLPGAAGAEPQKRGGDAAIVQTLRKAQGMLRQLSQEKTELEAKNAALEERSKALEAKAAQVDPLQKDLQQAKAHIATLQGSHAALRQQLGAEASRLQAVTEQQRKTNGQLVRLRHDNQLLVNAVKERTRWIADCTGKNKGLVAAHRELIAHFGDRSFWDAFKESEPLTGLGAVARENAVQEFRYKLDDLEVTPWRDQDQAQASAPSPAEESLPAGNPAEAEAR